MFAESLKDLQAELIEHPIYRAVESVDELRRFMRIHVFAVWDFMSLAKSLQNSLTCTQIPWVPPLDEASARLINDIILNEESDVDRAGVAASHLTLYLKAMQEIGAPTDLFDEFLSHVKKGAAVDDALREAGVPAYAQEFVSSNIFLANHGSVEEVASCFLFGREESIPIMFRALLHKWGIAVDEAPGMIYYLERHIELDSKQHGPAATKILEKLIGNDSVRHAKALHSAQEAIRARIRLWDGLLDQFSIGQERINQVSAFAELVHE
ncbi:hypothetical protein CKO25_20000 [Thiocapsa imhoffii]|uniref:DUF3050 domain-containing protein n=1 Tax=Thiocapsa imhoffii TaxID=382777 RepID=A0A9X0WN89_9GAMM|nr:DUF3050 domain-containing protein [Thiocapsa imhoffii]MBK1646867.1 hypothetical protein [Thiocapsa imhoffii]